MMHIFWSIIFGMVGGFIFIWTITEIRYRWELHKINKAERRIKIIQVVLDRELQKAYNMQTGKKECVILEFKKNESVKKN